MTSPGTVAFVWIGEWLWSKSLFPVIGGNQRRGEFKQNFVQDEDRERQNNVYVKFLWRGSKRSKHLYSSSCVSSPPLSIVLNLLTIPFAGQ